MSRGGGGLRAWLSSHHNIPSGIGRDRGRQLCWHSPGLGGSQWWDPQRGLTPGFSPTTPSHPVPAERRHGPLSKLYARATAAAKCHVAINGQPAAGGTPSAAKVLREKPPGARGRVQPLPERPDKDNNLW